MRKTPPSTVELSPREKAEQLAAVARKDREFHRRTASEYDRDITSEYAMYHRWNLYPWIRRAAVRHQGGKALDVGTGTGAVAVPLADAGFRVIAIDHSPEMLRQAAAKSVLEASPLLLTRADVLCLPFAAGTFDVVTMQGILHHVPLAVGDVVGEAARVLKAGGEFYVSEPCSNLSLLGRVLRLPLRFKRGAPDPKETDEEALPWGRLRAALDGAGLEYQASFMTHVPYRRFRSWLTPRVRLLATLVLSFPFRRGDILFVHGRKRASTYPP